MEYGLIKLRGLEILNLFNVAMRNKGKGTGNDVPVHAMKPRGVEV
jgi:hypothetical protein